MSHYRGGGTGIIQRLYPLDRLSQVFIRTHYDTDSRTVINNNPLPDITHEEFIALLGPLLAPENYAYLAPPSSSSSPAYTHPFAPTPAAAPPATLSAHPHTIPPRASFSHPSGASGNSANTNNGGASAGVRSPAPFDWIHFEGRSVKTTLSNIVGLDGLARERKWRSHCVFSVDVGRRARQGVEAVSSRTPTSSS
ncbi:hypothetical protein AcV7_005551 [Taiwanofungus camphoratus]|nr:hypothetical protein AcV7_005551 [Antrodia cinnamomea]